MDIVEFYDLCVKNNTKEISIGEQQFVCRMITQYSPTKQLMVLRIIQYYSECNDYIAHCDDTTCYSFHTFPASLQFMLWVYVINA